MKGYKISFEVYANSQEEADEAQNALVGFIRQHALQGRAVSAQKIAKAIGEWDKNIFVRNQIINFFKNN